MDESSNSTASSSKGKKNNGLMIAGIVLVLGIIGVAAYFIYNEYQQEQELQEAQEKIEKELSDLADQIEDQQEEPEEETISQELQDALDRTISVIRVIRVEVSSDLLDDLNLIEDYIRENPRVLLEEDPTLPEDVQAAVDRVRAEYQGAIATSENPAGEDEEVKVGNRYVVSGIIEVSDYTDDVLGTVYEVMDEELDVTLYFQFSDGVSADIEENMLGKEVTLELEITEITDTGVSYKVVSGPDLVEEAE